MFSAIVCYSIIGIVLGCLFSLLFINFDKSWKKIISYLFGFGGLALLIKTFSDYFEITNQKMKFWTTSFLFLMFILSFVLMMIIMCKLIKDKDDDDILRIRDILLGQKTYIDKYYESRKHEIDIRLGIPILEEREEKIRKKETILNTKELLIEEQKDELKEMGRSKLKIKIPYNNDIILTKNLLNSMPEYIYGLGKFIIDLRTTTDEFYNLDNNLSVEDLKSYLLSISTYVIKDIFETNSDSIRVHFRYYEENLQF